MINPVVESLLKRYQPKSLEDYENALKEIIQEITLLGLWRAKFFEVAGFYGGTALRILYGLDRFSEDMDFSLLAADPRFDLARYEVFLKNELGAFGFEVNVTKKQKTAQTAIESAFIKANTSQHLMEVAAHLKAHSKKTLKIKIEVDTQPPSHQVVEVRQHFRPVPFSVKTFSLPTLFAGKVAACLFRSYRNRVKGRDWFDFLWYVSRGSQLSVAHLTARAIQAEGGATAVLDLASAKQRLHAKIADLDLQQAKDDVLPFAKDREIVQGWTKELLHAAVEQLREAPPAP